MNDTLRVIVLDVSKPLCSEVYDEVIISVEDATEYIKQYIDMKKYRIVTV